MLSYEPLNQTSEKNASLDWLTAVFAERFRRRRDVPRRIGIESEFPIVLANGEAIPYSIVEGLFRHLSENGFRLVRDAETSCVVAVEGDVYRGQGQTSSCADRIELELGHCTLELALAPEPDLFRADRRLRAALDLIIPYLRREACMLLGYGIQPQTPPGRKLVSPKGKYEVYQRTSPNLVVPIPDGKDIHLFAISAANQCHIDVSEDEAVRALNVMNGLVGLQMALCVNSPIWRGRLDTRWKAVREMMYDEGMTNWNGRIGNPDRFRDIRDHVEHICACPTIMVKREGRYFALPDYPTAFDYFKAGKEARAERADDTPVFIEPMTSDLFLFAGLWWQTARLSPIHGTLEARGFCQQPPGETMAPPALILGILEQLGAAKELLEETPWLAWVQLREDAARHGMEAHLAGEPIRSTLERLLTLAMLGLQARGFGEEVFLEPLHRRLASRYAPADRAIAAFHKSGVGGLMDLCAIE